MFILTNIIYMISVRSKGSEKQRKGLFISASFSLSSAPGHPLMPLPRSGSFRPWAPMWELVVNKRDEEESQQCVTEIDQFSPTAPKRRQLQQKPEFLKRTISILQPTDQHDENRRTKFLRRKTICLPYFPYMDILLCILL